MADKIRELAIRFGMLHSDCRDSSADAFAATLDNVLRAELRPLLDAAQTLVDEGGYPTRVRERLAAEMKGWRQNGK